MPKYVLDEKGILTITSEHDGGIFTFNDILKKLTIVLLIASIVFSVGLYSFFYYDAHTTHIATQYCNTSISDYNPAYQFTKVVNQSDLGYRLKKIYNKIENYPMYYEQSFEIMVVRGQELIEEIIYQIESFRHRWR